MDDTVFVAANERLSRVKLRVNERSVELTRLQQIFQSCKITMTPQGDSVSLGLTNKCNKNNGGLLGTLRTYTRSKNGSPRFKFLLQRETES